MSATATNGLVHGAPQAFSGPALQLAEAAPGLPGSLLLAPDASLMAGNYEGATLVPGLLVQWGDGNVMAIALGTQRASNNNLFAAVQQGNGNALSAIINGTSNELAVLQIGDGNIASSEIDGTGNIQAISQ